MMRRAGAGTAAGPDAESNQSGEAPGRGRRFLPDTVAGRRALRLAGVGAASFLIFMALAGADIGRGGGPENSFFQDPLWVFFVLTAGICLVGGAAVALFAVIKLGERALSLWPVIVIGCMAAIFWLGETLGPPH